MNSPAADLRAAMWAGLRGLFVFVLAAAGATLGAQQEPTASSAVTVNVLAAPTATLTASPTTIEAGDEVTLTWTTAEAVSALIDQGVGALIPAAGGSVIVTPTANTDYTLTATNRIGGSVTASVTINVLKVTPCTCQIDTFSASSTTIDEGQSTTLSWTTTAATSVSIMGVTGTLALDGSTSVSPTTTTTYTLTASDGDAATGDATQSVTVTVRPPPCRIDSFSASPTTITVGESSELSWETTGATSVTLNSTAVALDDDDEDVTPPNTTNRTYTLRASGGSCTSTVTDTVRVTVLPKIDSFSASPSTITEGQKSTLSWTTTGADSASINQNIGSVTPVGSGSEEVMPESTTTYTLTATDAEGDTNTARDRVIVEEPECDPEIDTFSASPSTITVGESSELSWTTTDATSVSVSGVSGTLDVDDDVDVTPPNTTNRTYTLTASCTDGSTTASVSVTVLPKIDSFSASPSTITEGKKSTLSWTTTGADSASINQNIGSVTPVGSGSEEVMPESTTTYTLTATDAENDDKDATATVTVNPPCVIDTFSASPSTITVGESSELSWTTTDATSVSVSGVSGTLDVDDDVDVTPTTNTTYTLTASGDDCGDAEATATVNVVNPPVIDTYSANKTTINKGESVTLSWTTTDATSVSITGASGTLAVDGSTSVSPTATQTTYTLAASNSADTPATTTSSITVTIRPTAHLEANPTEIFGFTEPVDLTWSTEFATSASIDQGVGSVTPVSVGSTTVYPGSTTTYTLTASGPGGSATSSVEVFNVDSRSSIQATLTADPTTITAGGSTTLSWTTSNATRASLSQDVGDDIGSVTPVGSGSRSVSPTATTVYTLTASRGKGEDAVSATSSVTVTVKPAEP